jgi:hypothetical protein
VAASAVLEGPKEIPSVDKDQIILDTKEASTQHHPRPPPPATPRRATADGPLPPRPFPLAAPNREGDS